ncbi:MAG: FtsW/RodA/SpoVE family cell cycle protein, partial [Bacteroidales bacterium]|nr:FtsW/RodA/SpoVE family cell cycle protein [Bacteroidales bacterium]
LQKHHAKIAISQGKFLGVLPGNSSQRDFLPQAYSDFSYAIIIEDLGWLGLLGVPLIYIMLLFRCRKIAQSCTRMVPALLVMGCGLIVAMQSFVNMAVAVGFFPVTGQALPLVSRGGTSGVITCLYFALILSVSRFGASETEEEVWEAEDAAMAQAEAEHLAAAAEKIAQAEAVQQALSTEDYASMAE